MIRRSLLLFSMILIPLPSMASVVGQTCGTLLEGKSILQEDNTKKTILFHEVSFNGGPFQKCVKKEKENGSTHYCGDYEYLLHETAEGFYLNYDSVYDKKGDQYYVAIKDKNVVKYCDQTSPGKWRSAIIRTWSGVFVNDLIPTDYSYRRRSTRIWYSKENVPSF